MSSTFVHVVGRAPFLGKHQVKHAYEQGVRAARRGDAVGVEEAQSEISSIRGKNRFIAATALISCGVDAFFIRYSGSSAVETVTATLASTSLIVGLGHAASAAVQGIIGDRLSSVAERCIGVNDAATVEPSSLPEPGEAPAAAIEAQTYTEPSRLEMAIQYATMVSLPAAGVMPLATIIFQR
jgi:hypothetical protein